ncbi:MAG: menaquinone biosynthesis protein [Planctomycetota bacterium]
MEERIRFGCQNLINALPILHGLSLVASGPPGQEPCDVPRLEIVRDTPAILARMLHEQLLDVAVVPAIEYLRNADYVIASPVCIACCGPVESVKVYCRKPPDKIETLALDANSMSSAVLVRVLLARQYGVEPRCTIAGIGHDLSQIQTDAVLVIGDGALVIDPRGFQVLDLGEEWFRMTGLPFVFALCCCRRGASLGDLPERLERSLEDGLKSVGDIAAAVSGPMGIDRERLVRYLSQSIRYHLGLAEQQGLLRFFHETFNCGLWHEERGLEFYAQ